MPIDQYEDSDDKPHQKEKYKEFDCPSCTANNPCDPPFGTGDEVFCYYCGIHYLVKISEAGRLVFREV